MPPPLNWGSLHLGAGVGGGKLLCTAPLGLLLHRGEWRGEMGSNYSPQHALGRGEEGGAEGWQQQCMLGVVVCKADALLLGASSRVTAPPPPYLPCGVTLDG